MKWWFLKFALFFSSMTFASGLPEVEFGEKFFREERFSQPYFIASRDQRVESRFKSVNLFSCATCHTPPDLVRGYADSERRSSVPDRLDGQNLTLRNSPALIDLFYGEADRALPHLLHYDGEFETPEALVIAGFTGRNFGWLEGERDRAVAHLAEVVRRDYSNEWMDPGFWASLPSRYQLNLVTARDDEIVRAVAGLVSDYMRSLEFQKDDQGDFQGSPYDVFLELNQLPKRPDAKESSAAYSLRLLESVERLNAPVWVDQGPMRRHSQVFRFGPQELEGMKIFLKPGPRGSIRQQAHLRRIGNCAGCHAPPAFTDFTFRNTGVSQDEFDSYHGADSFLRLKIPGFFERQHWSSDRLRSFAQMPSLESPESVDLGAWNQLKSSTETSLVKWLCLSVEGCSENPFVHERLKLVDEASVAAFKTPTLRNLGHSGPYLHNGSRDDLEGVIRLYIFMGMLARDGRMRNADPEMMKVFLDGRDIPPLVSFLKALNEEYE